MLAKPQQQGIVARKVIDSHPPKVWYSLTPKGREVAEMLNRLDKTLQRK